MDVAAAAAVPFKYKRRSVSAVRHWPKGCGRLAVSVGPVPTMPPPAINLPESEEVTNGLPPPQADSSHQVEPLVVSRAPKQESQTEEKEEKGEKIVMEVGAAAAVPLKFKRRSVSAVRHWPQGCGRLAVAVGPVPTKPPPAINLPAQMEEAANGLPRLRLHPPPKRRKISAIRDFPVGCGRNAPLINRPEESSGSCSGGEKEAVVDQQPACTEVESDLEESGESRTKSASAPLKIRKVRRKGGKRGVRERELGESSPSIV